MKKILAITTILMVSGISLMAQAPPAPPADAGSSGGPVGGGAPIGSGLAIMIALAAGYGTRKIYRLKIR